MRSNPRTVAAVGLLVSIVCFSASMLADSDQRKKNEKYRPKMGVISIKGEVFGGEFRVTNVIPLRGDFSKYNRIEIVRLQSLIGSDVPSAVLNKYTGDVYSAFKKGGYFQEVAVVDSWRRPPPDEARRQVDEDFKKADSLEAPMLGWEDMIANDQRRLLAARREEEVFKDATTLVITGQVIDYDKGNKYLDLLPLNMGNAIITVRFSYYNKETGEELGRQIISSEMGSKLVPMLLSVRNTVVGLVEGLVDQITRRKAAAER